MIININFYTTLQFLYKTGSTIKVGVAKQADQTQEPITIQHQHY